MTPKPLPSKTRQRLFRAHQPGATHSSLVRPVFLGAVRACVRGSRLGGESTRHDPKKAKFGPVQGGLGKPHLAPRKGV